MMIIAISSCDSYLDVNTDPTRVSEEVITLNVLLPTVIEETSDNHYLIGATSARVTQHLDNIQSGYYQRFTMSSAWVNIYLKTLNNLETIIQKAENEGSPHYIGVARVLKAVNLGLLTDAWENAPYTEALQGSNEISPAYDSQESLYEAIIDLLDEGIKSLEASESYDSPSSDDLIYSGDMEKWIKAAHSLKARYLLHLSKKSANNDEILAETALGFTDNSDDFQLFYTTSVPNPWYFNVSKKLAESIYTQTYASHFMNAMNGTNYGVFDPRLPLIAEDTSGMYIGLASYDDDADTYTVLPTENTFHFMAESAIEMMTYSELKFIEAEAQMGSAPGSAYDAYIEGIRSNMTKIGVSDTDMGTYLSDDNVALNGTLDLEHLMKEKYIALMLNPEAWNDMRRHGFSNSVYPFIIEPTIEGELYPHAYRAEYPSTEQDRNETNYNANYQENSVVMWKDQ